MPSGQENGPRDQYSFATLGERHLSMRPGPHAEPDLTFANSFVSALSNKLAKTSYLAVAKQHGPGYLVVNIDYPLFDRRAHRRAKEAWAKGRPWPDSGCFKEVFLRMRSLDGYAFQRWVL